MTPPNIFSNIPRPASDEFFETILTHPPVKIERIVSRGHSSPTGFWYDRDADEWVTVLRGSAGPLFEGETTGTRMAARDYLSSPAHRKHRVEWTDPNEDTVWLAIYY